MTDVIPPQAGEGGQTFSYRSGPKPLQARKKYRNELDGDENVDRTGYGNIMFDRRIVRGNTYAQSVLPAMAQENPVDIQRKAEKKRAREARQRHSELETRKKSPIPVDGRHHQTVQTELYLEELTDRIEESDVTCQTDPFLDRPPTPLFVPAKTGVDVWTQILPNDLFDFDRETKPMLEVIVGKTVEQSLLEVMEEEELENLRENQRKFQETRMREQLETQRLEEQERRQRDEKERRKEQQREVRRKERETSEKIAARAYAQNYLMDMIPIVFGKLRDSGYFFDPVSRDIENNFLPKLIESVQAKCSQSETSRIILDQIIREVVAKRYEAYNSNKEE